MYIYKEIHNSSQPIGTFILIKPPPVIQPTWKTRETIRVQPPSFASIMLKSLQMDAMGGLFVLGSW